MAGPVGVVPLGDDRLAAVEAINRQILSLLASDGRLSFTELARQTGLSVSAVQQRVRRLEERGVIRGYSASIDPEAAGLSLTAFISIKPFDPAAPDDAPERLAHLKAIEACHSVAGDENYILKVRVATAGGTGKAASADPGGGQCVDQDDDRAQHAVRGPGARDVTKLAAPDHDSGMARTTFRRSGRSVHGNRQFLSGLRWFSGRKSMIRARDP